ncbi:hypothetical protein HPB47_007116, partial [Ixodes persulcatus]
MTSMEADPPMDDLELAVEKDTTSSATLTVSRTARGGTVPGAAKTKKGEARG